jgi:RNA polymerase sigma-70 factor (ECF subfamily)
MIGLSDEALVDRVVAGDLKSFDLLVRRHSGRLLSVARSVLNDHAEAEDAVQEAYASAYRHLSSFESRARFSTWLTRIVLYEALRRSRKQRRMAAALEDDAEPSGVRGHDLRSYAPDPEDGASDRELARRLAEAIDTLPADFRAVFIMRAVEDMSTAEAAQYLDVSKELVKTRLFRARALLRQELCRASTPEQQRWLTAVE